MGTRSDSFFWSTCCRMHSILTAHNIQVAVNKSKSLDL